MSQTALGTLSIKLSKAAPLLGSVRRNGASTDSVQARPALEWQLVFHLVGRALGAASPGDLAHDGWAIDVLEARRARARRQSGSGRSSSCVPAGKGSLDLV